MSTAKTTSTTADSKTSSSNSKAKESTSVLVLFILFVLWYFFNAAYNVYNSYVKDDIPFPFFASVAQLALGLIYALPLWILGIRAPPKVTFSDILRLLPIGISRHLWIFINNYLIKLSSRVECSGTLWCCRCNVPKRWRKFYPCNKSQ